MRFTVNDLYNSRIPGALGVSTSDPRLLQWLNEATERLLYSGKWWGTVSRFLMCASDGCITLPVYIDTIEAVTVCGRPAAVRDFWYEFLENGPGTMISCGANTTNGTATGVCGMNAAIMRGNFPVFTDIRGTTSKLNFICDVAADTCFTVLALGYDQNGNWIRTQLPNGSYQDGETIQLAQGNGTLSQNIFSVVSGIQFQVDSTGKSVRQGQVWLYAFDTVALTKIMIGHYQYFETNPSYARYFFPGVCPQASTTGACNLIPVQVAGKLSYIPVAQPTDYLIVGSLPALKEMMKAIKRAENEQDSVAANQIILSGLATAISFLDQQLDHHLGSGRKMGMNFNDSGIGSDEPIPVLL